MAYPYPGGSWDEYIDYVQTTLRRFRRLSTTSYGYMTWLNYMLAKQVDASRHARAWTNVSEQPVTALKDAVDVFLSYLQDNSTDDRVSLSIYTYSDGTAQPGTRPDQDLFD